MPLKILFAVTLLFAFAFFSAQFLDWEPDQAASVSPRQQISIFLAIQFFWLAGNVLTIHILNRGWVTSPGPVQLAIRALVFFSFFVQLVLVCLITPALDRY